MRDRKLIRMLRQSFGKRKKHIVYSEKENTVSSCARRATVICKVCVLNCCVLFQLNNHNNSRKRRPPTVMMVVVMVEDRGRDFIVISLMTGPVVSHVEPRLNINII